MAIAALLLCFTPAATVADPGFSYRSPFHPDQCSRAVNFGRCPLPRVSSGQARLVLAEGLLCLGLRGDQSALDQSIALLEQIVVDQPASFYAQLDLADAWRKRYPLSDEAEQALRRVLASMTLTDLGAVRPTLRSYIEENLAAVAQSRARTLPDLAARLASLDAGEAVTTASVYETAALLALTGPAGVVLAAKMLRSSPSGGLPIAPVPTVAARAQEVVRPDRTVGVCGEMSRPCGQPCGEAPVPVALNSEEERR